MAPPSGISGWRAKQRNFSKEGTSLTTASLSQRSHSSTAKRKRKKKSTHHEQEKQDLVQKVSSFGGPSGYVPDLPRGATLLKGANIGNAVDGGGLRSQQNKARVRHFPHQAATASSHKNNNKTGEKSASKGGSTRPSSAQKRAPAHKTPHTSRSTRTGSSFASKSPWSSSSSNSNFSTIPGFRGTRSTSASTSASTSTSTTETGHLVCAISENLARETCLACINASSPIHLDIHKQGNGNTYGETLACLEWLQPDEVLLNEGRKNSQLAKKIQMLFHDCTDDQDMDVDDDTMEDETENQTNEQITLTSQNSKRGRQFRTEKSTTSSSQLPPSQTTVKFLPRHYFDQTRGAELLRHSCRPMDANDTSITEEYILLASSHAALHYSSLVLGTTFAPRSLTLHINHGNQSRMTMDRATLHHLELLSNAKTGKYKCSLVGTLDCTRTTVGGRLLRRTLMAPPMRLSTIDARLDLVDTLLSDEEFFYGVMEHLESMPELDKMMSHLALVPRVPKNGVGGGGGIKRKQGVEDGGGGVVTVRMASRGISALVCIKSTLSVVPSFAALIADQLRSMKLMEEQENDHEQNDGISSAAGKDRERDEDEEEESTSEDETTLQSSHDNESGDEDEAEAEAEEGDDDDETLDSLLMEDDGTLATGHFTFMGELTLTTANTPSSSSSSPSLNDKKQKQSSRHSRRRRHRRRHGTNRNVRHPPNSLLLRAILYTMKQPALTDALEAVRNIFTESTTYSRNAHAMRHQECFALKPNTDGMMDVLRKTFLANVDDIYRLADEYGETYGFTVSVRETTARGYFLSIPSSVAENLPPLFIQPVRSGRFLHCTTEEVLSLNARAQENMQDLLVMTHERIQDVMDVGRKHFDALASLCDAIALLDMLHCFADNVVSSRSAWCRPVVTDCQPEGNKEVGGNDVGVQEGVGGDGARNACVDATDCQSKTVGGGGGAIAIRNGRYAIDVSSDWGGQVLPGGEFIPNDTYAASYQNFTVITGVNGSGKSTYLKQVAIIIILAHCGSYVPAEEAFVPVRDRLLTRIGTSDDQEHNISTFMLEMKETAHICNRVTDRSLILIDELGRATSNEDGVAIAWAICEFLLVKRALTFFVTHYPQITRLADVYPNVQNQHLGTAAVRTSGSGGEEIRYSHKIMPGPCPMSSDYGIEMAATCGWPSHVIKEAHRIRKEVEQRLPDGAICQRRSAGAPNLKLFELKAKAESILNNLAKHLVALKEGRLSDQAQRSYLQELKNRFVPEDDPELLEMMNKLLLSEEDESDGGSRSEENQEDCDLRFEKFDQSFSHDAYTVTTTETHEPNSSHERVKRIVGNKDNPLPRPLPKCKTRDMSQVNAPTTSSNTASQFQASAIGTTNTNVRSDDGRSHGDVADTQHDLKQHERDSEDESTASSGSYSNSKTRDTGSYSSSGSRSTSISISSGISVASSDDEVSRASRISSGCNGSRQDAEGNNQGRNTKTQLAIGEKIDTFYGGEERNIADDKSDESSAGTSSSTGSSSSSDNNISRRSSRCSSSDDDISRKTDGSSGRKIQEAEDPCSPTRESDVKENGDTGSNDTPQSMSDSSLGSCSSTSERNSCGDQSENSDTFNDFYKGVEEG